MNGSAARKRLRQWFQKQSNIVSRPRLRFANSGSGHSGSRKLRPELYSRTLRLLYFCKCSLESKKKMRGEDGSKVSSCFNSSTQGMSSSDRSLKVEERSGVNELDRSSLIIEKARHYMLTLVALPCSSGPYRAASAVHTD